MGIVLDLFRRRVINRAAKVVVEEVESAIDKVCTLIEERAEELDDMADQARVRNNYGEAAELEQACGELDDMLERIREGEWKSVKE